MTEHRHEKRREHDRASSLAGDAPAAFYSIGLHGIREETGKNRRQVIVL